MQRILFVSSSSKGRRAKYAREYFDEIEELSARILISTHGIGRWPSSRVPTSYCEHSVSLSQEDIDRAHHIIIMDPEPLYSQEKSEYAHKISHWNISEEGSWEEQMEEIQGKVIDLIELINVEIKTMYASVSQQIKKI